ncbi:uncharacterized protein LOC143031482 [Oratosquilla oratoria]|uniref:uncharacterized protein LOC143031482 n=1 Tax=Oratosquilla oratoria TaxID=337810 RepID=UPI003F758EAB
MKICPLCGKAFTTARRPRILLCYHTFCTECLEALYQDNTGIIPCPHCANEERYDSVQNVPIDLVFVKEGEEEDDASLMEEHPLHSFIRGLRPKRFIQSSLSTEPIAWPEVTMPHEMTLTKPVCVKLPNPPSFPYTTRIEYKADRMTCFLCGLEFSINRQARELQCGHSLCSSCVTLHVPNISNPGSSQCPRCRGENLSLLLETHMSTLTLEETQDTTAILEARGGDGRPTRANAEDIRLVGDICNAHGCPLSSWCQDCHHAVCDDCREFHEGQQHQVSEFRQPRELLYSYHHVNRTFRDWLFKVQNVTADVLDMNKSVVSVLELMLSTVQSYMKEISDQEQIMVRTSSLETMEEMITKSFYWCRKRQPVVHRQIKEATATFQRISFSLQELMFLQALLQGKMVEAEAMASLMEEQPHMIALPQVTMPFILTCPKNFLYVDLPESVDLPYTLKIEFLDKLRSTSVFTVTYEDANNDILFRMSGDFGFDTFRIFSNDPPSGMAGPTNERKPSGLRNVVVHQMAIVEDHRCYEIFLNGNLVTEMEKVGLERSLYSFCRKISIRAVRVKTCVEVQYFSVTSGRNV